MALSDDEIRGLYDRHFAEIHRFLRHQLGEGAADDLAAETFVRACAARARFEAGPPGGARAWLFAIAANLARDELRRRSRGTRALARLAGLAPDPPSAPADPPDPALAAAVRGLRAEERTALLLLAWADLSYDEIAAVTGVAPGTVRSRLNRARTKLREKLALEAESLELAIERRAR